MAQSTVAGRASPLIASKLMRSYLDNKTREASHNQTMRSNAVGMLSQVGTGMNVSSFNYTASSNFGKKEARRKNEGNFEQL